VGVAVGVGDGDGDGDGVAVGDADDILKVVEFSPSPYLQFFFPSLLADGVYERGPFAPASREADPTEITTAICKIFLYISFSFEYKRECPSSDL